MIEIQNYAPFIQLAVAFDFACVKFGNDRIKIKEQISGLATIAWEMIDKHNEGINPYINSVENEILHPNLANSKNSLKSSLIKISERLKSLKQMNAHYLGPVSLLAGLYSMIALLLIGEIDGSTFLLQSYTYVTEFTFVLISIFVILEIVANYKSIKNNDFVVYPHIYLVTILLFFFGSSLSLYMAYFGYNIGTFPYSFTVLSRLSLFIPFISFLGVLFWLISFIFLVSIFIVCSYCVRCKYRFSIFCFWIEGICAYIKKALSPPKYKEIEIVVPPDLHHLKDVNEKSILRTSEAEKSNRKINVNLHAVTKRISKKQVPLCKNKLSLKLRRRNRRKKHRR